MLELPAAHLHRGYRTEMRSMRVAGLRRTVPDVLEIDLVDAAGAPLAPYRAGSHLILAPEADAEPRSGWRNAYSLTGDGFLPDRYSVSVLRRPEGHGSVWLHEHARVGMTFEVEGPRSNFPLALEQRHALLLAGGIGVTPILSHARALVREGCPATVLYAHQPSRAAHLGDLQQMAEAGDIALVTATSPQQSQDRMRRLLGEQPLGTHAYACGPLGFLDFFVEATALAGWPRARVHLERFEAPPLDAGDGFDVVVASSGERLRVAAGTSMLAVLEHAGLDVRSMCREGICGECLTPVRRAVGLEHRDYVLTDQEKQEGLLVLPCVSRAVEIEVDL